MKRFYLAILFVFIISCAPVVLKPYSSLIIESAFSNNEKIPVNYTCDSENINPPLYIKGIPPEAESLSVIVEDIDAPVGTFIHWIIWNIKPGDIQENSAPGIQGLNSFQKNAYGGPCPPSGIHRYFFKVYALDAVLDLTKGGKRELDKAMEGHILAEGELIGLYR